MKTKTNIRIEEASCIQCRLCALECPSRTSEDGGIRADQNASACDRCFHCYSICPQHAIRINGYEEERIGPGDRISYQELFSLLKERRSIRNFTGKPVPSGYLEKLTDATRYGPTGGNFQDLSVTIVQNREFLDELRGGITSYYDRIVRLLRNPLVRVMMRFSPDVKVKETAKDGSFFKRIEEIYSRMKSEEDPIFHGAPVVMLFHTGRLLPTASEDCILAAYNVVLSAVTLGLGSCFVSLSQQAITGGRRMKKIMGIPASDRIHAVLIIGFPAVHYRRVPPRKEKLIQYKS